MFELNTWGYYEVDFYYNDIKRILIANKLNMAIKDLTCFYKDGDEWIKRSSGMSFNIKHLVYYLRLKTYLDKELNIYLRKLKIKKISS